MKMGISLSKGQVINLTKSEPGLHSVVVGLGWDPIKNRGRTSWFGGSSAIDCDAFCVAVSNRSREAETIYFGHTKGCHGAIIHTGDNLTGDGDGDDEQIIFNLDKIPSDITRVVVGVNIYRGRSKKQTFGDIQNAFIRIVNTENNSELCKYNLSGNRFSDCVTVTFGELYIDSAGEWQFKAVGEPSKAESIGAYTDSMFRY